MLVADFLFVNIKFIFGFSLLSLLWLASSDTTKNRLHLLNLVHLTCQRVFLTLYEALAQTAFPLLFGEKETLQVNLW